MVLSGSKVLPLSLYNYKSSTKTAGRMFLFASRLGETLFAICSQFKISLLYAPTTYIVSHINFAH